MKNRVTSLLSYKNLGASGTEVIDINVQDPISRIDLYFDYTVATVSVMTDHPAACIQKIEIVDGSEVLFSLTGKEALALVYYSTNAYPYESISLTSGGLCSFNIPILFGRWTWDKEFCLVPGYFKNLQLRITWDEDAANASVTTNHCDVQALCMTGEDINPVGFLTSRLINSQPLSSAAHFYVDIDTSRVIRQILMFLEGATSSPGSLYDNVKLSADGDKIVYCNLPRRAHRSIATSLYNTIYLPMTLDNAVTAKTIYQATTELTKIAIDYDATAFVTAQSKFAVPTITAAKIALAASVDIKALTAMIAGIAPHHCYPLVFGDLWEPAGWIDATQHRNLIFDLTSAGAASSSDTFKTVIEQWYKYGV